MRLVNVFLGVIFSIALMHCSSEQEVKVYTLSYPFVASDQGWIGGFADYPEDSVGYHLHVELDTLPYKINPDSTKKGLRVSGINGSDDLFMYVKKQITGLRKNTTYQLLFSVRIASNAATSLAGAGGAPGESVFVKVGGFTEEPQAGIVDGYYHINLDKGNQAEDGENMITIGHVGVSPTTTDYTLITRFNNRANSVFATTNEEGELWLIIGTDSGFEGKTTLYYTQVDVMLNEAD